MAGFIPWEVRVVCGVILTCYILWTHDSDANFDFSCRRQSLLQIFNHYPSLISSRRPRSARQCAEAELMPMHYRLSPNWRLFGRLQSLRTFSVNNMPRVASGTAGLCTSFTDMPFPLKVKAPSLRGLFSSSKKRTKTQGQGAQNKVPDR